MVHTPLRYYDPSGAWDVVGKDLSSPAADGSVVYYQDTLSPLDGEGQFIEGSARAVCQYLKALAIGRGLQVVDGPYLQLLEDDGAVPPGWQMLRALIWVDEYDQLTPLTDDAVSDAGLVVSSVGCQLVPKGGAYVAGQ